MLNRHDPTVSQREIGSATQLPSRGLLCDCTTGCGTDGSICGTTQLPGPLQLRYTSRHTHFEWRNKTMKISDELTLLLYSFLLPCLCPDPRAAQLNPSLTNKSILQRLLKKDSKRFQKCKTTHFSFCNKTNTIYPSKAWSIFHNIFSQLSILALHSLPIPEVSWRAV